MATLHKLNEVLSELTGSKVTGVRDMKILVDVSEKKIDAVLRDLVKNFPHTTVMTFTLLTPDTLEVSL